ncbi:nuclear transport factor 2 family protein [uncultured Shimia sp.]|uniref:nuclear transport factor 2 family protein n=1 Tax=uncultured Shimia sp. TaxID=573152 RepID=UPI0025CC0CB3|nr:nuclear transport factor 2 family protein [uncultured Shimia sp.]
MTASDFKAVGALMETYFEGLHQADSVLLRTVFHPQLAYVCATPGDELFLDLETYMDRVNGREPPAKRGDPRSERVLEIAFPGERLAHVTAQMSMMGRVFLDVLTLVDDGTGWRIVTKVFTYVPQED